MIDFILKGIEGAFRNRVTREVPQSFGVIKALPLPQEVLLQVRLSRKRRSIQYVVFSWSP